MTAGWGESEVLMDVSFRRLARVLHRLPAEHGLLSFLSFLSAFRLHVTKRNQGGGAMMVAGSHFASQIFGSRVQFSDFVGVL